MSTPFDATTLAHVQSAAALQGIALAPGQAERVATHLQRTRGLAAVLEQVPLEADAEPDELFCPAPFPAVDEDQP